MEDHERGTYSRLAFDRLRYRHLITSRCSVLVALFMRDEGMFVGSCEGMDTAGDN